MDDKKEKKPMGRPVVVIDLEMVEDLASNGCKQETIADLMEFSVNLFRTHKDLKRRYKKAVAERKARLRFWQTQRAKAGDTGMLIWLGKQELGQREPKNETEIEMKNGKAIEVIIDGRTED